MKHQHSTTPQAEIKFFRKILLKRFDDLLLKFAVHYQYRKTLFINVGSSEQS